MIWTFCPIRSYDSIIHESAAYDLLAWLLLRSNIPSESDTFQFESSTYKLETTSLFAKIKLIIHKINENYNMNIYKDYQLIILYKLCGASQHTTVSSLPKQPDLNHN